MSNNEKLDICNKALLRAAGVENPKPQYEEPETEQPDEVLRLLRWVYKIYADGNMSFADNWYAEVESFLADSRPMRESGEERIVRNTALGVILNYRDILPKHLSQWAESKIDLNYIEVGCSIQGQERTEREVK